MEAGLIRCGRVCDAGKGLDGDVPLHSFAALFVRVIPRLPIPLLVLSMTRIRPADVFRFPCLAAPCHAALGLHRTLSFTSFTSSLSLSLFLLVMSPRMARCAPGDSLA